MARRRGWGGNPPANDAEASKRIVATAVDLIGRTGEEITIADVSAALGVIRQTVYRYFPTSDSLMNAAANATVDVFVDRLAAHVEGTTDPVEVMIEGILFTLAASSQKTHIGLMLNPSRISKRASDLISRDSRTATKSMFLRFDIDWAGYGYDDRSLDELVEFVLRTLQSILIAPGDPPRSPDELRAYLRRWMGSALLAQDRP